MINKTISLSCYNRPKILRKILDSLKEQMVDLTDYKLYINCEPTNNEVINIVKNINFIETDIVINDKHLGLNANNFAPINRAFTKADFNLYWEDDVVLSPDALNLFEWYIGQDLTNIASMVLCNIEDKSSELDENLLYKVIRFCGWGFVISNNQFEKYFKPVWFSTDTEYNYWDKSSSHYIRTFKDIYNIMPQLSRATTIGRIGTNMREKHWRKHDLGNHKYNLNRKKFDYYLKEMI